MTTYPESLSQLIATLPDAERVIAGSLATDPTAPTPCTEYDVDALRAHLNAVLGRINAMGRGDHSLSVPDSVPSSDYVAAWQRASSQTAGLWGALTGVTTVQAPWRALSALEAAEIYGAEVAVHTWDLARATGQHYDINDAAAVTFARAYEREVPSETRAELFAQLKAAMPAGMPWEDPFGPAVTVDASATNIERVVALSGRDPQWRP
ncbi:MAG: hypothetical protein V9F00_13370 [Nocardioides sp.]